MADSDRLPTVSITASYRVPLRVKSSLV